MNDMEIKLPYLSEEKSRHGQTRYYVRWKGKRARVLGRPKDPGFFDRYRQALRSLQQGLPASMPEEHRGEISAPYAVNSLGWLIDKYLAECPEFARLARIGKVRRRRILGELKEAHGRRGMIMATEAISAGLAKRADLPGAANEWLKSIKALYSWAGRINLVKVNPASGVRRLKVATEGFHIWSLEEIKAYVTRHPKGSMAYLALMTLLLTGLRRSDATRLGRQHIRDGVVRFRPSKTEGKTGGELITVVARPLAEAMQACPPPEGSEDLAIIRNAFGRRFPSGAAFGNWFKDRCVEAGLAHCTAHGLRKAGASIAADEGASDMMLEAMFVWSDSGDSNQSRTYTRNANKQRLATEGFALIEHALERAGILKAGKNGNRIVAPTGRVAKGATKTPGK